MATDLAQQFCALRDTYIEKQFGRLNDMQRKACLLYTSAPQRRQWPHLSAPGAAAGNGVELHPSAPRKAGGGAGQLYPDRETGGSDVRRNTVYLSAGSADVYKRQGLGYSSLAMFAGVAEMVARAMVGFWFVPLGGYFAACIANPVAWFFACFFLIPAYFAVRKRLTKENVYGVGD